jgi:hypothetical protein
MDRPDASLVDNVTKIGKAHFTAIMDAVEAEFANFLPLSGGTMTGLINFVSGQIFDGSYITIPNPSYVHSGIYTYLRDHINDDTVHLHEDIVVQLQPSGSVSPQSGNISIDEDMYCSGVYAYGFYGDGSNLTGLMSASDSTPTTVGYPATAGISPDVSRSDHNASFIFVLFFRKNFTDSFFCCFFI